MRHISVVMCVMLLRTNGELDEEFKTENGQTKKYVNSNAAYALCFDYDSLKRTLDLNLETYRMTEAEMSADVEEEAGATEPVCAENLETLLLDAKELRQGFKVGFKCSHIERCAGLLLVGSVRISKICRSEPPYYQAMQ